MKDIHRNSFFLILEKLFFDDEKEYRFYMETILIRYISNYLSDSFMWWGIKRKIKYVTRQTVSKWELGKV